MKTILVALTETSRIADMLDTAVRIAEHYGGHIIGYYPIPAPALIIAAGPGTNIPVDDSYTRQREQEAVQAEKIFDDKLQASGLQYEWRAHRLNVTSFVAGIIAHGREADLICLPQDPMDDSYHDTDLVADVALAAGRPVLALPPRKTTSEFKNIAIGWNASREACRAAFDSLPLLQKADEVTLLWVNPDKTLGKSGKLPGTELAAALARHDVKITTQGLSNRQKASEALINYAKDNSVDLLVIGAYGHMRLREQILGGVTERILKTMPCPVLLSH